MPLAKFQADAEAAMKKGIDHLKKELDGIRTGRASPGLVEFVKVEAYGAESDIKSLAMVHADGATGLVIKPFDQGTIQAIIKGIEKANIGLRPMSDGKQIRISLPALSGDRRKELAASVKKMAEEAKVTMRNGRRDANKGIETAGKDKKLAIPEDAVKKATDKVQDLLKKYEAEADKLVVAKTKEIETV